MKCPKCGKELICKKNGVPIYTNGKVDPTPEEFNESYVFNGDLWHCDDCNYYFIDGINPKLAKSGLEELNEIDEVVPKK